MTPTPPEQVAPLLTSKQASRLLAISPKALYNLRRSGAIKAVCLGHSVRYELAAVHELIAASREVRHG